MVIVEPATKRFNPLAIEPEACRNCSSEGLYRWGERKRKIKDRGFSEVMVKRYRCKACKRTFTAHPEGLVRSPQTIRYQAIRLTL